MLVAAPVFAALILVIAAIVGRRILALVGVGTDATTGERAVISLTLGLAALQVIPFALGAVGALSEQTLCVSLAVVAAACIPDLPAVWSAARRQLARRATDGRAMLWLLLLGGTIVIGLIYASAPALDADAIGRHLAVPQQWLADGTIGGQPGYTPTNSPSAGEMLFSIGLATIGDSGAKMLHAAACALAVIAAYLAGRRVAGRTGGEIAGALVLLRPLGMGRLAGDAMVEGFVALAVAAALLAWLIWIQGGRSSWLTVASLPAGFAVSFRLAAVIMVVGLVMATAAWSQFGQRRLDRRSVVVAVVAFLAPVAPWLIRAAIVTGNPVFPILSRFIPSNDFPPAMAQEYDSFNRVWQWGRHWARDINGEQRQLMVFAAALLVLGLTAVFIVSRRSHRLSQAIAAAVAVVIQLQLLAAGFYPRYWMASVLAIVLAGVFVVRDRLSSRAAARAAFAMAALLSTLEARSFLQYNPQGVVKSTLSAGQRSAYLDGALGNRPIYDYANAELPDDAVVLQTYVCAGFYLQPRDVCGDMLQGSIRFDDWEQFVDDMATVGVTHVIAPTVLADGGPPTVIDVGGNVGLIVREDMATSLTRLLSEQGQLLITAGDFGLYAVPTAER